MMRDEEADRLSEIAKMTIPENSGRLTQRQSSICHRVVLVLMVTCILSTSTRAHPGSGIAVDRLGQVYFLDTGSGLWKIDPRGALTHLSGTLFHWLALDENNRFS